MTQLPELSDIPELNDIVNVQVDGEWLEGTVVAVLKDKFRVVYQTGEYTKNGVEKMKSKLFASHDVELFRRNG